MNAAAKEPVSPWPHAVALVLSVLGILYLIVRYHTNRVDLIIMCVYGFGLLALFGSSSIYHWLGGFGPRRRATLRRIDHASIFVMIACSYTPVLFFGLDGVWRIATIAAVWSVSLAGIVLTMWFVGAPRYVNTAIYAGLGWAAVVPSFKLVASVSHVAIALIAAGGLLYTFGATVYAMKWFNIAPGRFGFHEIFHLFVVAAAAVQFVAIAFYLVPV